MAEGMTTRERKTATACMPANRPSKLTEKTAGRTGAAKQVEGQGLAEAHSRSAGRTAPLRAGASSSVHIEPVSPWTPHARSRPIL